MTETPVTPAVKRKWGRALRRVAVAIAILAALGFGWSRLRRSFRPAVPAATAAQRARAERVTVLRDEWGIAHIRAAKDADVAFGLAYAHAEDDYPTIETVLAASRGQLSLLKLDKTAVINDAYVDLFGIEGEVERRYETDLSAEMRAVFDGYADGLNLYASDHPGEVDSRLLPFRGQDIAAGFIHKLPFLEKLNLVLEALLTQEVAVGDVIVIPREKPSEMRGSNAHAVSASKSADGIVRLNSNSHQPWEGPVAWHELHLHSDEGWNAYGANFPGAPMVLVGHNEKVAWTHTVNHPDLVDVYKLTRHPEDPDKVEIDGAWVELERREGAVAIDTGLFNLEWNPTFYRSPHGPVLETPKGELFAIRIAGFDRLIRAGEQWFRMNKAQDMASFEAAMKMRGIPMFNTVAADSEDILYLYNAALPVRKEGVNWREVLPGNDSSLIWTEMLPYERLPRVFNPPSGFVQNCNSTPYETTTGEGNPKPEEYSATLGIETRQTNRAMRSIELFGSDASITHEEFVRYKFDRKYSPQSPMYEECVTPILEGFSPNGADETRALELLKAWDGQTNPESVGASLAVLSWRPTWFRIVVRNAWPLPDPLASFREAVAHLKSHFGTVEVPLGDLQRLRHGGLDLPMGGGPDILNAFHGELKGDGRLRGVAGDCFILVVELPKDGPIRSHGVHQYGNVNRPNSPHYVDQATMFQHRQLRETWFEEAALRRHLESEYHPGQGPR